MPCTHKSTAPALWSFLLMQNKYKKLQKKKNQSKFSYVLLLVNQMIGPQNLPGNNYQCQKIVSVTGSLTPQDK